MDIVGLVYCVWGLCLVLLLFAFNNVACILTGFWVLFIADLFWGGFNV